MTKQPHPEWLINLLNELPGQREPDYENKVQGLREEAHRFATDMGLRAERKLEEMRQPGSAHWRRTELSTTALRAIADDGSLPLELRFNAYFVWQTQLWRRYDYQEFRANVRHYASAFSDLPMFDHQQAMALLSRFDLPSLQEALRYGKDAVANLSSSPGVLNLLAEIVAELGEHHPDSVDPDDISAALKAIGKAIDIDRRYGKYYANRARLLALEHRYDEAIRDIRTAMEVEPSSDSPIYALRLSRYEFVQARIEDRRQQQEWLNEQRMVRDEIRRTRSETMLMLGLLAAVVGFIVTGFDIATDYEPLEAGAIIGILAGSILIVFTGFGELVRFGLTLKVRTVSTLIAGLVLLGASGFMLWSLSSG